MFNTRYKYMRRNSMVRDLLDANTPSNSRTALEALATTLNPPVVEQPTQPTQVGMFDQASVPSPAPYIAPRNTSSSRAGEWQATGNKVI